jgi:CheY-like chemotaxis protein
MTTRKHPASVRILIVEDEQIIGADLAEQLEEMGHAVVGIAASGNEAIRMAQQTAPELVMMDYQLGSEMTGEQAAERIRKLTGASIIYITAFPHLFEDNPRQTGELCIGKPFFRQQIAAAISAAVAAR